MVRKGLTARAQLEIYTGTSSPEQAFHIVKETADSAAGSIEANATGLANKNGNAPKSIFPRATGCECCNELFDWQFSRPHVSGVSAKLIDVHARSIYVCDFFSD